MSWQIGLAMNLLIMAAYLGIAFAILDPLIRTGQLRTNRLGFATAAIFFTCAVHHGHHALHMLLPAFGLDAATGEALRAYWRWDIAVWDVVGAAAGVYYWTLRKTYGPLMRGAVLFDDLKEKQRRAVEINDNIVQGLTVAKMALELDQHEKSKEALESALESARGIITDLLGTADGEELRPGDLRRRTAARTT